MRTPASATIALILVPCEIGLTAAAVTDPIAGVQRTAADVSLSFRMLSIEDYCEVYCADFYASTDVGVCDCSPPYTCDPLLGAASAAPTDGTQYVIDITTSFRCPGGSLTIEDGQNIGLRGHGTQTPR